jgi:hypothetical protein
MATRLKCDKCDKTFRQSGTGLAYHKTWAHEAVRPSGKAKPSVKRSAAGRKAQMCRVRRNDRACLLTRGHKAAGRRHKFENVNAETLSRSMVADSNNGKLAMKSRSRRAVKVA